MSQRIKGGMAIICMLALILGYDIGIKPRYKEVIPPTPSLSKGEDTPVQVAKNLEEVIEVTEKLYVTYINDIYTNTDFYIGKTIKIQGMFKCIKEGQAEYYFVYRVGPGCCGNDGSMCGFEFITEDKLPQDNEWIEVEGVLETYEEEGCAYLRLKDSKVTIQEKRGKEIVSQ